MSAGVTPRGTIGSISSITSPFFSMWLSRRNTIATRRANLLARLSKALPNAQYGASMVERWYLLGGSRYADVLGSGRRRRSGRGHGEHHG